MITKVLGNVRSVLVLVLSYDVPKVDCSDPTTLTMSASSQKTSPRTQELLALMHERILILDGAMGTMIHRHNPTPEDWGGDKFLNCSENMLLSRPAWIGDIHRAYLKAGADIIETNTFGATPLVLAEFGLEGKSDELNTIAVRLAKEAAAEFATPAKPRFVAGSLGPTTRSITVQANVTFQELMETYQAQARALLAAGVDIFLVETVFDTRNAKAAVIAVQNACAEAGVCLPVMVSGTIERSGTMLAGQTAEAFAASLQHIDLLALGLNCATGPDLMTGHIRSIHDVSQKPLSCYPNAGLPDEDGRFPETPASLARALSRYAENGWLNVVGGCCGTTHEHIAAIAEMAAAHRPRPFWEPKPHRSFYCGTELLEATDDNRPLLVGERTNVIGSRAFKKLIAAEKWEESTEIARKQIRGGAHIVDVCLQSTERDESQDIPPFYDLLIRKAPKAPVMVDTTDPAAVELSLTYLQGKAIVNSINLEDGEEKFEIMVPVLKKYGAAVVVGSIDEDPVQAQAFTRERKLAIAQRSHALLTQKYGLAEEDLIFDPLVFPCASGDENYIGAAVETIEGIRLIKQHLPHSKTVLGISNVSFGLPPTARETVNSVFVYECTRAGLDLAIVNAEKLERYASLPEDEKQMARDLLFNTPVADAPTDHPQHDLLVTAPADWREQTKEQRAAINQFHIQRVTAHFRGVKREKPAMATLPLDERLARYVIEGVKEGLVADLELKRAEGLSPLQIINGPLMVGMNEVGRLFNNNELIVAEVLQSAEAMKTAVAHLEQFMEKTESAAKGKVVLATVKGDVHDIGKNLVEIILSNNGYTVVNLGIKVPPEEIIAACKQHAPDAIGLSGLLVKSAHQMIVTAEDLKQAGIETPVLVGGAALSLNFTRKRITPAYDGAVLYCKDAMEGLSTLNALQSPDTRSETLARGRIVAEAAEAPKAEKIAAPAVRSSKVRLDVPRPPLPYSERRVLAEMPEHQTVFSYINPQMLYVRHLGLKGSFDKKLAERDAKALELNALVEEVKAEAAGWLKIRAVWRYFEAEAEGNALNVFEPGAAAPSHSFHFQRQAQPDGLCLADYVLPPLNGVRDHFALFVVSAGDGVREKSEEAKNAGAFLKSHVIQALAIETAEAAAEWLHRRIREEWGYPDPPETTMRDRFRARYHGKRYSFGYPACPNLEDQVGLFGLLHPEDIGVGCMMEPEASVSAVVFHHPGCDYFAV